MLRTILVPLDGSAWSAQALPVARAIAAQAHARLQIVHVHIPVVTSYVDGVPLVDDELDAAARANDEAYMAALRRDLAGDELAAVAADVLDGDTIGSIVEKGQQTNADLIVMTTHGRGGVARMWMGSVADGIMHRSHLPLLLIRPAAAASAPPTFTCGRILIPLDGSVAAERVIDRATALGTLTGAEYQLLHIVEAIDTAERPFMPHMPTALDVGLQTRITHANTYLSEVVARLEAQGLHASAQVLAAEQTAGAILLAANEHCADVIVMATHGRGGVAHLLLGSVADKVVRGSDRPVLLLRP